MVPFMSMFTVLEAILTVFPLCCCSPAPPPFGYLFFVDKYPKWLCNSGSHLLLWGLGFWGLRGLLPACGACGMPVAHGSTPVCRLRARRPVLPIGC